MNVTEYYMMYFKVALDIVCIVYLVQNLLILCDSFNCISRNFYFAIGTLKIEMLYFDFGCSFEIAELES